MMRSVGFVARLLGTALLLASWHAQAQSGAWDFRVYLNDSPIGYHRFTLREQGGEREMKIEANFNVKILFINAYHYVHDATERWRGNCLESLTARTDDNGEKLAVDAALDNERLAVTTAKGRDTLGACVMSFAYWNPAILTQTRLFNAQTGRAETVQVKPQGSDTVEVRGVPVAASRWRITGTAQPIDLWYAADGEWIGLDAAVSGGRRLSYRLK